MKTTDLNKKELNFEKIWLLFQNTDKKFQDTDKKFQDTDKKFQDTDKKFQNTDKKFQDTDKKINEMRKELSGIGKSNGQIAEEFFYAALDKSMKFLDNDLEYIEKNVSRKSKSLKLRDEFDIVLTNNDLIVIVEVKYKVRTDHIEDLLNKKISNYRKLFPLKKDFNIRGAIAGFAFDKEAIEKAKEYGFYILSQSGENLEILFDDFINY